jgi:outer membrane lipoprotein-sorting protein
MKSLTFIAAIVIALSIGVLTLANAQTITVEEVLLAVLIDDFKVEDYSAQIIVAQGTTSERRGSQIYQKLNKLRSTFTEDGDANPVNAEIISDSQFLTAIDRDVDTVDYFPLGQDPSAMDFRSLYYASARSPIMHWTFADGSTRKNKDPSNIYDLVLQGADIGIQIKVDVARRVILEKSLDFGGGRTFNETRSNFALTQGVYLPGTRAYVDHLANSRVDVLSGYLINQQPDPSIFEAP